MNDTLLMVFTGVLTFAVIIQTLLFFGIYKGIRRIGSQLDGLGSDLRRDIGLICAKIDEGLTSIKAVADGLKPIREKLAQTTDIVHNRVSEIDHFLAETTSTVRLEVLRIRDIIQSASQKAEETLDLLHKRIAAPLNEISAINRGVRVALDVLFRRRRTLSGSQDEEMFI